MEFHKTIAGKHFFESQLPRLITALADIAASLKIPAPVYRIEQEVPPDFLKNLYYGQYDPLDWVDADVLSTYNKRIIAHQDLLRNTLSPDVLALVDQHIELLDDRGTVEREQAFSAGFSFAATMFAAGLVRPVVNHAHGGEKDGNNS